MTTLMYAASQGSFAVVNRLMECKEIECNMQKKVCKLMGIFFIRWIGLDWIFRFY